MWPLEPSPSAVGTDVTHRMFPSASTGRPSRYPAMPDGVPPDAGAADRRAASAAACSAAYSAAASA
ncbi:hypothetical protein EBM89_16295, partial [Cellulomonas triticagri]